MEQNRAHTKTHLMWSTDFFDKNPRTVNEERKLFLNKMLLDSWTCALWERNKHKVSPHTISKMTHK